MRTSAVLLGVLLLSLVACNQDSDEDTLPFPVPPPQSEAQFIPSVASYEPIPVPPDVDYYDLTERLRGVPATSLPRAARSTPPPERQTGTTEEFTVTDLVSYTRSTVSAELRLVTPNAYWYVDHSLNVNQEALERSAKVFEEGTYPTEIDRFGDTIKGGFDGDRHLTILITRFGGAAGYYSSPDEYPKDIHPYSNERLMLYINGGSLRPGSNAFNMVVAHELQHALHWHGDSNEESWINEGLSTLAEELNGYRSFSPRLISRVPAVQLTHWEDEPSSNGAHYASAHLFLRFLSEHYGGYDKLGHLLLLPEDSIAGINAYLTQLGYTERFVDVFKAWVVANYGGKVSDPRYQYKDLDVQVRPDKQLNGSARFSDTVPQYAARYIESQLPQGSATITFEGSPTTDLLPTQAQSGRYLWWSNRGDSIDSSLTRELNLEEVQQATLRFKAWFDIEKGWDYAYITISPDNGQTWELLQGTHTSLDNPLGNSYGPGFTGKSGGGSTNPAWVQEEMDLTPYAGKKVLVRFEYVTDEAVNNNGLALDDIEVPEIGFRDDAESVQGWDARGFFRTTNEVSQDYVVQILSIGQDDSVTLQELSLDTQRRGEIRVCCYRESLKQTIIIIGALAPATTIPAEYTLTIQGSP